MRGMTFNNTYHVDTGALHPGPVVAKHLHRHRGGGKTGGGMSECPAALTEHDRSQIRHSLQKPGQQRYSATLVPIRNRSVYPGMIRMVTNKTKLLCISFLIPP